MGREICRLANEGYRDSSLAAKIDKMGGEGMLSSVNDFSGDADVIIDFSHHTAAPEVAEYAAKRGIALVMATTGHTDEELAAIKDAANYVPVFMSANMSLGVALLVELAKKTARVFPDADIEIIEKHHNRKLDAPSGTAVSLAEVIAKAKGWDYDKDVRHGRVGLVGARTKHEIGMHSIRGGDVVGDHTVLFAATGERVELTHKASSRDTFAKGALRAARFLMTAPAGYYDMQDVLNLK